MNNKDVIDWLKNWLIEEIEPQYYNEYLKKASYNLIDNDIFIIIENSMLGKSILSSKIDDIQSVLYTKFKINYNINFKTLDELNSKNKIDNDSQNTFDNFVTGKPNQDAYNLLKTYSKNPKNIKYNPIFIYGKSGIGKTHLLNAVNNELTKQGIKTYYKSSWEFRNQYGIIAKSKKYEELNEINSVDVLLIDDISYIIQNKSTETLNYFFGLFSDFIKSNKQVILTSEIHPNLLEIVDERLRTRFLSGLPIEIKELDHQTSKNIVKFKLEEDNITVDDAIINYIAENYSNSVREIIGVVNRINYLLIQNPSLADNMTLDVFLENTDIPANISKKGDIKNVFYFCCQLLGVNSEMIRGPLRQKQIVMRRNQIIWLIKQAIPNITISDIGTFLGNRDHSTINNSLKKIEEAMENDKDLKKYLISQKKKVIMASN